MVYTRDVKRWNKMQRFEMAAGVIILLSLGCQRASIPDVDNANGDTDVNASRQPSTENNSAVGAEIAELAEAEKLFLDG